MSVISPLCRDGECESGEIVDVVASNFLRCSRMMPAINLFKIASDPTRLRMLNVLRDGDMDVTTLCGVAGQSQPAISHHLALMRLSGAVESRRDGKRSLYSITNKGLALLFAFDAIVA